MWLLSRTSLLYGKTLMLPSCWTNLKSVCWCLIIGYSLTCFCTWQKQGAYMMALIVNPWIQASGFYKYYWVRLLVHLVLLCLHYSKLTTWHCKPHFSGFQLYPILLLRTSDAMTLLASSFVTSRLSHTCLSALIYSTIQCIDYNLVSQYDLQTVSSKMHGNLILEWTLPLLRIEPLLSLASICTDLSGVYSTASVVAPVDVEPANPLCGCGVTQTMAQVVNTCPVYMFEGGLPALTLPLNPPVAAQSQFAH